MTETAATLLGSSNTARTGQVPWVRNARTSPLFSAARVLLVITLLAAPLAYGAVQAWAWGSLGLIAVSLFFLWVAGNVRRGFLRLVGSPLYVPAVLLLIWGFIQSWAHLTLDPTSTRESVLKLTTNFIFFFLAVQLFSNASVRIWRSLGHTVVIFASLLSLFSILQFFSSPGTVYGLLRSPGPSPFGPYVNHNHYAGLMEMLIAVAAGYVLSLPKGHPLAPIFSLGVLVSIASLLLSGSRGGLVSLGVESLLLATLPWRLGVRDPRRLVGTAALSLLAPVALFLWIAPPRAVKRLATLVDLKGSEEAGRAERLVVSADSIRILGNHLWVGSGLGSFETVYPQYQSFPSDARWDHAHNDYTEALVETGLPGGVLILLALAMFFRLAFTDVRERLKSEVGRMQLGAAVGCCGLLVHSFSDFNLHIPANAAWFAFCAALAGGGRNPQATVSSIIENAGPLTDPADLPDTG